jgi:hypothetical protein
MKKLLIAATAVGTAASLVLIYLRKRQQGHDMLEDAKGAMRKSGDMMRKYMHKTEDKAGQVYSSAMD